jgi:hypothetical protein
LLGSPPLDRFRIAPQSGGIIPFSPESKGLSFQQSLTRSINVLEPLWAAYPPDASAGSHLLRSVLYIGVKKAEVLPKIDMQVMKFEVFAAVPVGTPVEPLRHFGFLVVSLNY